MFSFILQYYTLQAGTCIVHTAGQEKEANMNLKDSKQADVWLQFLEKEIVHYTVSIHFLFKCKMTSDSS